SSSLFFSEGGVLRVFPHGAQRCVEYSAKDVPMNALNSAGHVTVNAEGKQYAASYQLQWGVITVTSEFASRVIRVEEPVGAPESLARTILRAMVSESCQSAEQ